MTLPTSAPSAFYLPTACSTCRPIGWRTDLSAPDAGRRTGRTGRRAGPGRHADLCAGALRHSVRAEAGLSHFLRAGNRISPRPAVPALPSHHQNHPYRRRGAAPVAAGKRLSGGAAKLDALGTQSRRSHALPCDIIKRIRGKYRLVILIKGKSLDDIKDYMRREPQCWASGVVIDVDPSF